MPGMNGGSSRSWYSPRRSNRSGKLTPAAPMSTTMTSTPPTSSTSMYVRPDGPESSRATSAFIRGLSAETERGRLSRRQVGDLAPLAGDVVDARHTRERDAVGLEQRGALHLAAADDEDRRGLGHLFGAQIRHDGCHVFGGQLLQHFLRKNVLGHAGGGDRCDGVGLDVVLRALLRERVDQADQAQLGGAVIGLAEVAEQAAGGGGDDDAAVALLAEVWPCRADHVVAAVQVHLENGIPCPELHLVEGAVAQDARVAHHAVDLAELVDRGLDDVLGALGLGHGVVIRDGAAAGVLDLLALLVGHVVAGAGAVT